MFDAAVSHSDGLSHACERQVQVLCRTLWNALFLHVSSSLLDGIYITIMNINVI